LFDRRSGAMVRLHQQEDTAMHQADIRLKKRQPSDMLLIVDQLNEAIHRARGIALAALGLRDDSLYYLLADHIERLQTITGQLDAMRKANT
jgi:hypothetical protein